MQAWKTRSGKPDGVSAQHTSEGFLKSRGAGSAGSRHSGPVKLTASLDSERRILCQRTAGRKYIVNVGPDQADGSLRRVEPTWRGVRVANVNTARSCKQTLGSSGEQRLNRYRDVRLHSGRYLHRSCQNNQSVASGGEQQHNSGASPILVYKECRAHLQLASHPAMNPRSQ